MNLNRFDVLFHNKLSTMVVSFLFLLIFGFLCLFLLKRKDDIRVVVLLDRSKYL